MLKKAIFAVMGLLVLGLLIGRSHLRTTVGIVKESVRDSVPIEFEIKRARQMIKQLQPEIEQNMHRIAREETEVAKLERQLARAEEQLARDRDEILKLKGDLDSGSETFVYAGRSYTAREVQSDLTNRFDEFKTQEGTTQALKKILSARQKGMRAAHEKLEGMLAAKSKLEVDVENLEARLKMVEVAQTTSDFNFDDSQLARTKDLLEEIGDRIEVAERLLSADTRYHDRIPVNQPQADRDIKEEIADYFGDRRPEIEAYVTSGR